MVTCCLRHPSDGQDSAPKSTESSTQHLHPSYPFSNLRGDSARGSVGLSPVRPDYSIRLTRGLVRDSLD
eukprot:scaffold1495_cov362-Pavlova_lutheri.AAC.4